MFFPAPIDNPHPPLLLKSSSLVIPRARISPLSYPFTASDVKAVGCEASCRVFVAMDEVRPGRLPPPYRFLVPRLIVHGRSSQPGCRCAVRLSPPLRATYVPSSAWMLLSPVPTAGSPLRRIASLRRSINGLGVRLRVSPFLPLFIWRRELRCNFNHRSGLGVLCSSYGRSTSPSLTLSAKRAPMQAAPESTSGGAQCVESLMQRSSLVGAALVMTLVTVALL